MSLVADRITEPEETETDVPVERLIATPFAVNGLGDLLDPDARIGTHFSGPVMSGGKDLGAAGIAVLHKRAKIVSTYGAFSIPIKFPPSSILTQYMVQLQQSYNGTLAKINLGTTLNGTDIANVDVTVAPTQIFNNITSILGTSWTIYLSQVPGAGATQGKCTVMVFYSVPGKAIWS